MSLAVSPLSVYGVLDPVVTQQSPTYPVVSGARAVSYQVVAPNSVSDASTGGNLQFDVNPAHENVYLDRRIYLRLPVRMKIDIATGTTGCVDAKKIINANGFALRSFPAQKAMETIVMNINGLPSSIEIGKVISALELFNIKDRMRNIDFSKCATYPICQSEAFSNLAGTSRSPLALRSAGPQGALNLGTEFTVISNADTASNGGSAWVDFVSCEPLYLSPLYFGPIQDDHSAFLGINSMSLQFNFASGGGSRMVAIDPMQGGLFNDEAAARAASVTCTMYFQNHAASPNTTAWSYLNQSQAAVLVKQLAPSEIDENLKLKIKNYPYTQVRVWNTSIGSVAAAASSSVVSQNMQLASVPSRVYAYIRLKDSELRRNPFHPDTFLQIPSMSCLWGVDSRLNGASQEHLYDIAAINGLDAVDWQSWNGNGINLAGAAATFGTTGNSVKYTGCGSVISFGPMDLGLPLRQAPGKSEYFNLQLTLNYKNQTALALNVDLFVCVVSQGIYSIYDGQSSALLGILSENDVLNANKSAMSSMLTYGEAREVFAGSAMGDLKGEMKAVMESAKPAASKGVSRKTLRERLQ